jgi:hypothetical protein
VLLEEHKVQEVVVKLLIVFLVTVQKDKVVLVVVLVVSVIVSVVVVEVVVPHTVVGLV